MLAVGRMKAGPERELCERYLERVRAIGPKVGLRRVTVQEVVESRATRSEDRIADEAAALLQRIGDKDRLICLDERGESPTSLAFAEMLERDVAASVARMVFAIGGADGLAGEVVRRASRTISFGRMTFPHQLVRVMLAEQLYRAPTILSGHPYHRA